MTGPAKAGPEYCGLIAGQSGIDVVNKGESDDHDDHDGGKGVGIAVATFLVLFQFFFVS
jgi:hypothetical protein